MRHLLSVGAVAVATFVLATPVRGATDVAAALNGSTWTLTGADTVEVNGRALSNTSYGPVPPSDQPAFPLTFDDVAVTKPRTCGGVVFYSPTAGNIAAEWCPSAGRTIKGELDPNFVALYLTFLKQQTADALAAANETAVTADRLEVKHEDRFRILVRGRLSKDQLSLEVEVRSRLDGRVVLPADDIHPKARIRRFKARTLGAYVGTLDA